MSFQPNLFYSVRTVKCDLSEYFFTMLPIFYVAACLLSTVYVSYFIIKKKTLNGT